jgi:hypothetical protein
VEDWVRLGPRDTAAGRDFTAPAHTAHDLRAVDRMLEALRREVASGSRRAAGPTPLTLEAREPDGRVHRTIVCDAARLGTGRDVTWVGFFAEKRRDRDPCPLTVMDDTLIGEFPAHPEVLSYSSLELDGGDWGNLILLEDEAACDRWREGERHAYAARELAPYHYATVRLHRGVVPGGVLGGRGPVVYRTKYYDYQGGTAWRGARDWPA